MAKRFSTEQDLELIEAVKQTGDSKALTQLINTHSGVYADCLSSSLSSDYDIFKNELREDKDYYMWKFALDYDPSKNMKYPVYVGQRVKWMCMNIVNRSKPWQSLEEGSFDCSYEQEIEDVEQKALDEIKSLATLYPDNRIVQIIDERYFSKTKPTGWKELSKKMNCGTQSLMNLNNKFLDWARPKMKKYA